MEFKDFKVAQDNLLRLARFAHDCPVNLPEIIIEIDSLRAQLDEKALAGRAGQDSAATRAIAKATITFREAIKDHVLTIRDFAKKNAPPTNGKGFKPRIVT